MLFSHSSHLNFHHPPGLTTSTLNSNDSSAKKSASPQSVTDSHTAPPQCLNIHIANISVQYPFVKHDVIMNLKLPLTRQARVRLYMKKQLQHQFVQSILSPVVGVVTTDCSGIANILAAHYQTVFQPIGMPDLCGSATRFDNLSRGHTRGRDEFD
eukprot:GHVN01101429.1.p1 GENE.GHVN01101429.1~~GHVN01101429.1.p1  ORF type:complete len:155 (-),score=19.41 GHVN01101429.1:212-676(-)